MHAYTRVCTYGSVTARRIELGKFVARYAIIRGRCCDSCTINFLTSAQMMDDALTVFMASGYHRETSPSTRREEPSSPPPPPPRKFYSFFGVTCRSIARRQKFFFNSTTNFRSTRAYNSPNSRVTWSSYVVTLERNIGNTEHGANGVLGWGWGGGREIEPSASARLYLREDTRDHRLTIDYKWITR